VVAVQIGGSNLAGEKKTGEGKNRDRWKRQFEIIKRGVVSRPEQLEISKETAEMRRKSRGSFGEQLNRLSLIGSWHGWVWGGAGREETVGWSCRPSRAGGPLGLAPSGGKSALGMGSIPRLERQQKAHLDVFDPSEARWMFRKTKSRGLGHKNPPKK